MDYFGSVRMEILGPSVPNSRIHSVLILLLLRIFCIHTIDSIAGMLCLQAYGPSMLPTLNIGGDVVLVEHLSPRIGKIGHGDLVLVRSPLNPNRNLTKRVVAMEGDTVTFFDASGSDSSRTAVVPKGHVWIQGDNIYASRDSRHFGPVPYGLIKGKVFFRVWPPSSFGLLDN